MSPESPSEAFPSGSAGTPDERPVADVPDDDPEEAPLDPAASLALVEA